jgi:ectoine hydroxylase-related dioxygenase (phytanoyl-CoA dioxygenase family)
MVNPSTLDLDSAYPITREHIEYFRQNGFIKLKDVLAEDVIKYYGEEITRLVIERNTNTQPLGQRDTYGKAFLQVMNLWEYSAIAAAFVMSKRLGRIAAELLEVTGVRLYHDQALYKEAGGGITPWHADQYYWPLSSDRCVTAWIPLQATSPDMGPLAFCIGSHKYDLGRHLPITDESEQLIKSKIKISDFKIFEEPFDLGEVSYHLGWTFHRAGNNTTDKARAVMTIIYMDENMRLAEPRNQNQINDWHGWCPGAEPGEIIASPKNPVIYSSTATQNK